MPMDDYGTVRTVCVECGDSVQVTVDWVPLARYLLGEQTVQVLFYDRAPAERDIISGFRSSTYLCETCWDLVINEEEE